MKPKQSDNRFQKSDDIFNHTKHLKLHYLTYEANVPKINKKSSRREDSMHNSIHLYWKIDSSVYMHSTWIQKTWLYHLSRASLTLESWPIIKVMSAVILTFKDIIKTKESEIRVKSRFIYDMSRTRCIFFLFSLFFM